MVITGASGGIGRELAQQLLRVLEMRCLLAVGFLSFVASCWLAVNGYEFLVVAVYNIVVCCWTIVSCCRCCG